jgi:hypothetical protein
MDHLHVAKIAEVTLVDDGAMITFADGLCAIYPAAVLHACLSLANIVSDRHCEEVKEEIRAEHRTQIDHSPVRPSMV